MLRRIRVRGFKSFATPVDLEFGPGVNVIVGPNGSGKSNLAEAIVWSMGEQRATRLRASGMAEVVFSGGEGRPAAGLAEVRLTVSPAHPDPERPAETEVARRLTRTGEATYQVNGTSCRLLDVHEQLGTLGLGPDALAVIRQGQVEAVCTARPADLRAVIEEAAGVALSRRRRRRAEAKLARVAERLDRARDLASELVRRRATLERQARAAARAAELDAQVADARRELSGALAATALREEFAATAEVARCRPAADAAAAALAEAQSARATANAAWDALTASHDTRRESVRAIHGTLDRIRGRAELAGERLQDIRRQQARDAAERAQAVVARGDAELHVTQTHARRAAAAAAADEARDAHEAAVVRLQAAEIAAQAAQAAAADARTAADDARRVLASADARRGEVETARATAEARLARLADGAGAIDVARAERRAAVAAERATRWAARTAAADAALGDAQAAIATIEQHRRELAATVNALRPSDDPVPGVLGAGLSVVPGTERAFGAALGVLADATSVRTLGDAERALDSGMSVVLVETGGEEPAPTRPSAGRPLIELVSECDPAMRSHLERLLSEVALVDDLTAVPVGAPGLFVTRRGDAWRPLRGVRQRSTSEWALQAEHRVASVRLVELDAALGTAGTARVVADRAATEARARRRAAERAAARAAASLGVIRAEDARALVERADATAAIEAATAELAAVAGEHRQATATAAAAEQVTAASGQAEADAATALSEARGAVARVEGVAATVRAELGAATLAVAEADEQLAIIDRRVSSPERIADLAGAERAVDAVGRVVAALADRVTRLDATLGEHRERMAEAERVRDAVEVSHREAVAAQGLAMDALHRAELTLASAAARAHELLGDHEVGEPDDAAPVDPDEMARAIDELERRRRMIGGVNELATTEFDETADRVAEIEEQVTDLEAASCELTAHMQGLDDAVADGFQQVFDVVRQRFHDAVGVLFPGGQGRLERVESEDGEPGIEIQVVPAGKRARPLAMMSGGERSLIALAFCMAIAMTRPAPFYLLDEVEAALDDTNLRRFLALVRRLADETQFVLITHQQPTVEIADTLFGVTMGSDGVSQIVSRRLGDDISGAARPLVRHQLKAIQGGRA
jgi:chromosome segregation protein